MSAEALVCLSWAASVMQGHKNEQWTLPQALDFAFELSVAPLAKEIVVVPGNKQTCEPIPRE